MRDGSVRRSAARKARALRYALVTGAILTAPVAVPAAEADRAECQDDAILIVDASGSMASTDPSGNVSRIHRVRQAAGEVVPQVAPTRNLGLMVYGGGATNGCSDIALTVAPGANNTKPILDALRDLLPNGRTPLTESILRAAEALKFRTRAATIVLLTDGEESCGGDPCKLADRLRREGLRTHVHVIDYKTKFGSDWRGTLQSRCIAETTGGRYVAVNTVKELIAALRDTLGCNYVTERITSPSRTGVPSQLAGAACRDDFFAGRAPERHDARSSSHHGALWLEQAHVFSKDPEQRVSRFCRSKPAS